MGKITIDNEYDVIYTTISGRTMIARKIFAKNEKSAKSKLLKEMKESKTFRKIAAVILIR